MTNGLISRPGNGFPENFLYVNPQFNGLTSWGNTANSNYHSMQVQVTRRLRQGFSGQFSYVWSKALGDPLRSGGERASTVLDPRNQNLSYSRLNYDRTQTLRAHGVWELPFGPNQKFLRGAPNWVHRVVEGWELSGILGWNSGAPLALTAHVSQTAEQSATNYANLVGNFPRGGGEVVKTADGIVYFLKGFNSVADTTAYFGTDPNGLASRVTLQRVVDSSGNVVLSTPGPGQVGNLQPGWINGPSRLGLDMSIAKRIRLSEGKSFTLRADVIDILNTPQFGTPNTNITNAIFGTITSATGAREITINARIDF